jgi:hypothetical protein
MASWGARESEHRRGNEKEHTREREDWQARELAKLDERERRNCNEFILARDEASQFYLLLVNFREKNLILTRLLKMLLCIPNED